jgi:hypothetical protein
MQITIIIMQVGLERPDMNAGSICWKVRSIKSPQTENVERERGLEQPANPRRYGYLALTGDRLIPTCVTTTTARGGSRRVHPDALQSMRTLLYCPSYCLNTL